MHEQQKNLTLFIYLDVVEFSDTEYNDWNKRR